MFPLVDISSPSSNGRFNNGHPLRVSDYRQFLKELNFDGFDFASGFKCTDVHKFEKLNDLSINVFEMNFYQYQSKWKPKLLPFQISKRESDRVVDFLIY